MEKIPEIIFYNTNFGTKKFLSLTCKTLQSLYVNKESNNEKQDENAIRQSFTLGLTLHAFINALYKFQNNDAIFSLLSKKCDKEYKNSLIYYYRESVKNKWANDVTLKILNKYLGKGEKLSSIIKKENIYPILEVLIKDDGNYADNNAKLIKCYIPYFNTSHCINLIKKELGIEKYKNEWSLWNDLITAQKNDPILKNIIHDICSFFNQKSTITNLKDIYKNIFNENYILTDDCIKKAVKEENISVLVLFNKKSKNNFWIYTYNAQTDQERKILTKAHHPHEILGFIMHAIRQDNNIEKTESFLHIAMDHGNTNIGYQYVEISNFFFQHNLMHMFSLLLKNGHKIKIEKTENLSCEQIKKYIEEVYEIYKKKFWDEKEHKTILHKAVQENDIEFVKYLLSLNAPTNTIDKNEKIPILYSLNNNDIFNILIQYPSKLSYLTNDEWKNIERISSFIKSNPEENIIQLLKKNFFSIQDAINCLEKAIPLQKNKLCLFLLTLLNIENDKNKILCWAIAHKNEQIARYILIEKNINFSLAHIDRMIFRGRIFLYQRIIALLDDQQLINNFQTHKKEININYKEKLIFAALKESRFTFAKLVRDDLINNNNLSSRESHNQYNNILSSLLNEAISTNNIKKATDILQKYGLKNIQIDDHNWNENNSKILCELTKYGYNAQSAIEIEDINSDSTTTENDGNDNEQTNTQSNGIIDRFFTSISLFISTIISFLINLCLFKI